MTIATIMVDPRQILTLSTHGEGGHLWCVGDAGVEKIVPYQEVGQMAHVTWFAVYVGGEIRHRVNGTFVDHIRY